MKLRAVSIMGVIVVALGAVLYVTNRPTPVPPPKPRDFIWSFGMTRLKGITISLPRLGKSESWIKHSDAYWYFAGPGGPRVNNSRWGGGIPLLLSGPEAKRVIAKEATAAQLAGYGLLDPQMEIRLSLDTGKRLMVDVGDQTPAGNAYYLRLANSRAVFTVDYTWYDVLHRLVVDPPYPVSHRN